MKTCILILYFFHIIYFNIKIVIYYIIYYFILFINIYLKIQYYINKTMNETFVESSSYNYNQTNLNIYSDTDINIYDTYLLNLISNTFDDINMPIEPYEYNYNNQLGFPKNGSLEEINSYLNQMYNNELQHTSEYINRNNIEHENKVNNNVIKNKSKQDYKETRCTVKDCRFKQKKNDLICKYHNNLKHNKICTIDNCMNQKYKSDLCYKHFKPLCKLTNCKLFAASGHALCKKHIIEQTVKKEDDDRHPQHSMPVYLTNIL